MYICRDCGYAFDEPIRYADTSEHFGCQSISVRMGCPNCCGDFCEAKQCSRCGEYITPEQARFGLCADCEIQADARFKELIANNFTANEIDYLNNQYDGEWFPGGCEKNVEST